MELDEETRDSLEVAALLHDVGKIGVPDKVLLKPGRLQPEEIVLMSRHAARTIEILASCGVPQSLVEIVHYSRSWYNSNGQPQDRQGDELPLASRMLSIVDAFDSMTTDHVYRPARSRERALAELFQFAGSQFDPELVRQFEELFSQDQNLLSEKLARRWLHRLPQDGGALPGRRSPNTSASESADRSDAVAVRKEADRQHARRRGVRRQPGDDPACGTRASSG